MIKYDIFKIKNKRYIGDFQGNEGYQTGDHYIGFIINDRYYICNNPWTDLISLLDPEKAIEVAKMGLYDYNKISKRSLYKYFEVIR